MSQLKFKKPHLDAAADADADAWCEQALKEPTIIKMQIPKIYYKYVSSITRFVESTMY